MLIKLLLYLCNIKNLNIYTMKNKSAIEESNNQIVEYLTMAAAHGGYCWDGVRIDSGTAVTCMKTIANATGLSYYRVKKCIAQLVEAGRITVARHKSFAIITFCVAQEHDGQPAPECQDAPAAAPASSVSAPTAPASSQHIPSRPIELCAPAPQPFLNRAARRRLARQEAKVAARKARRAGNTA